MHFRTFGALQQFGVPLLLGALAVPAFGLPESLTARLTIAVPPALTFGLALLPLLSIAGLLHLLGQSALKTAATPRQALRIGGLWGLGFFLGGVSWVYVSLAQFSGLPAPAAALATLLFCTFLALFPALVCAAYAHLRPARPAPTVAPLLFAALWTLGEWLRGTLFTGFPWLSLGYAQMPPSPLAGYASVLGVYGVSFVSAWLAALVTMVAAPLPMGLRGRSERVRASLLIIALIGAGLALRAQHWTTPVGAPIQVRLLQGNVPQDVKWQPEHLQRSLLTYLGLAQRPTSTERTLTVLPETAIPLLMEHIPEDIVRALTRHGDVLLGAAVSTPDAGYLNAAVALPRDSARPAGLYAKQHLVPFGEFSPPGLGWFFRLLRIPMADFTSGAPVQAPLMLAGVSIAPNVCYEDLFGEELIKNARNADLLINLSNTAWFGDSLAQPQHLQIARMRALETGRVMLRATNSGVTAMIEPDGLVSARLPAFSSGALTVQARPYAGLTPYARWGNAPILLAILLVVFSYGWRARYTVKS